MLFRPFEFRRIGNKVRYLSMRTIVLLVAVGLSMASRAETLEGKIVAVHDGNTIEIKTAEDETYKVMLDGVDSPELTQEFGPEAQSFLEKLVLKKNVKVELMGKDRWGNRLGVVWLRGEVDIRVELLKAGLAWTAERSPIPEFETIKEQAQTQRKGLWVAEQPTPPWVFRRQQTMLQPKHS